MNEDNDYETLSEQQNLAMFSSIRQPTTPKNNQSKNTSTSDYEAISDTEL